MFGKRWFAVAAAAVASEAVGIVRAGLVLVAAASGGLDAGDAAWIPIAFGFGSGLASPQPQTGPCWACCRPGALLLFVVEDWERSVCVCRI